MDTDFKPENAAEIADIIAWAVSDDKPLEVVGRGTRRKIGRAAQYGATLNLSGLTGVTLYEPEELVLSARAGTPLSEIESLLAEHSQELAFEPPNLTGLLGVEDDAGSIGGAIACNFSGPRRLKAGAARDHFLGVNAISGRGEMFKSGGRVVKNVTGYDLCKMLAGSWGTLAVMSDVTVKVLPAAETETTLIVTAAGMPQAVQAMSAAMQSTCEVSGACHIPAALTGRSTVGSITGAGQGATALRLEGIAPSVAYRADRLTEILKSFGAIDRLEQQPSRQFWREVRDVGFLSGTPERIVWKLSVVPGDGAQVLERLEREVGARGFLDWAGGLIWLDLPALPDGGAQLVRAVVRGVGGHATLIRADEALRASVDVFHPQADGIDRLSVRLKQGFDPSGVLNAGRMRPDS